MAPGDLEKAVATYSVADNSKESVARTYYPNSNQTTENSATRDEDENKSKLAARLTKIFITSCVFGVLLDPLFLYIPLLNQDLKCLRLDNTIKIIALVSRLFTDLFYVGRIILHVCRFENYSPSIKQFLPEKSSSKLMESLIKGFRDLLPEVSNEVPKPRIGKEIWESSIIVDILAILPLPQVAILFFFPNMRVSGSSGKRIMNFLVMGQYVPRVLRIYLSCKKAKKPFKGHVPLWLKGLLNLFLYILASHVLGAFWYFFAAQRMISCWEHACRNGNGCGTSTFNCHDHQTLINITVLNDSCPINLPNTTRFDFGIYLNVLQSDALWSTDYPLKFLNSFCWGLRNLSSFASNLQPSFYTWEITFVAFISIIGLILFVYLIGNLQTYVQLDTGSLEKQRRKDKLDKKIKEKDQKVEKWLSEHGIPLSRKPKIMEEIKGELVRNSDFDVLREISSILPRKLINSCSPLSRLRKVPLLKDMDKGVLREISDKLKPENYTPGEIIINKDEPLQMMLFIVEGRVTIEKTDGSRPEHLDAGKFYGVELLVSPSSTSSGDAKPINESIRAIDDVQALVLYATDMESIGSKSKSHFKKLCMVTILQKVPLLKDMHEGVLREISEKLKLEKYTRGQIIIEKAKTLEKMLFIVDGHVTIEKTDGSRPEHLDAGKFYGEELLVLPSSTSSSDAKPINESVRAIDDVQALVLYAIDMESIGSKSKSHFKKLCMVTILKKVPLLKDMDEGVLREVSEKLKPEKYIRGQIIIEKDKTLEKMLFILDGRVTIEKTDGSRPKLGAGDFYGGNLLVAPLWTSFGDAKPINDESIEALDDVQALVLYATDMESIGSKSKYHFKKLCMVTILKKVPLLKDMDEGVLREISEKLKPKKYNPGEIIINKDETLQMMLFIVDGHVTIEKIDGSRPEHLGAGKFYGEELLVSPSWTSSGDAKPINEYVRAIDDVQALVLSATDMATLGFSSKSVVSKFMKHFSNFASPSDLLLTWLKKVPLLKDMDEGVLREISEKLKPEKYTRGKIIIEKDKTLEKMFFIVDGCVRIVNPTHSMRPLGARDFYGGNLLVAPSWTSSGDAKPINEESVEALDDVQALVLYATDMESIGSKSKSHFKKLYMVTVLKKVEIFQQMDEQVLKAISKRLKPMNFNAKQYILKEKKPLNMMFFVVRGVVLIKSVSAMDVNVKKTCELGSFYGEELVHWVTTWVSHQTFPTKLPLSPDSALCSYHGGSVEILALKADDLKSVLSDFTLPTDSDQPLDWLTTLKNVERLETMDVEFLKKICGYLELRTYEDAYIIQKDKPIEMMFFIMSGVVSVTDGSSKHYLNEGGRPNHSGDDLVEHWLQCKSTGVLAELPTSHFSFWAIGEVEVLVLKAEDLAKVQPGGQIR
ncbi:uncharacterized protein LOC110761094 isoform X2 [Prunus avium]|uniref:Uncharacterized protein LOC110761094 isoform X2 n=1 Tax=Prunus avium TaxID=42229 RepID=A0A6P5SQQ1_PRUAV|nr:uncharacterized protein LOC110761094 isoform X2 [Prunus avium]